VRSVGFELRHMGSNLGIASALNAGLRWAELQQVDFVITFDQDSEPASDMVARLLDAHRHLMAKGVRVGALGPQQVDRRSGKRAAFLAPIHLLRHKLRADQACVVEVDHLITSGCLIPTEVWQGAGSFLDELFIDYVDIEWCLRLRSRGWHLFGVGSAVLNHSIGDTVLQWCGYQVFEHSPLRHYYLMRNGVHLQKLRHITLGWKIADGFQLLKKLIFFSLTGPNRWDHFKAMVFGIRGLELKPTSTSLPDVPVKIAIEGCTVQD
jgi:rhamnosyltransferase